VAACPIKPEIALHDRRRDSVEGVFVGSVSGLAFNAGLEGISREPLALAAQVDPSNTNGVKTAKVKPKTSCFLRQWFGLTP
jgi:hypothetical protein